MQLRFWVADSSVVINGGVMGLLIGSLVDGNTVDLQGPLSGDGNWFAGHSWDHSG